MAEDDTRGTAEDAPATSSETSEGPGALGRFARGVGQLVLVAAGAIMTVFALANRQPVSFSWLVGETTATTTDAGEYVGGGVPLIALLLAAFVLGIVFGSLLVLRRRSRGRRRS